MHYFNGQLVVCVVNLEQKIDDQKQNMSKTFLIALLHEVSNVYVWQT